MSGPDAGLDADRRSRIRGCLLGGAIGDALGAGLEFLSLYAIHARFGPRGATGFVEAYGRVGPITDDTQMTLFTAEGLLRAASREAPGPESPVVWHAYLRWLHTQGVSWREAAGSFYRNDQPRPDGWLVGERFLHARRAPGATCLSALASGRMGTLRVPINSSKGCGGVMRAAPAGILPTLPAHADEAAGIEAAFELGCAVAAITHGHPSGYLTAGVLAATVHGLLQGQALETALRAAMESLRGRPRHQETTAALQTALALAREGDPTSARVERLGAGWTAEEALAIAVYAALAGGGPRRSLLLAVNHSGDSDSTGAICGNLVGALHGESALPREWLDELEGRDTILRIADDLAERLSSRAPGRAPRPAISANPADRYPPW